MHPEATSREVEIAELWARYGVTCLDVFGSAARGKEYRPQRSDADFLVEFGRIEGSDLFAQHMDFLAALRTLRGTHVDLLRAATVRRPELKEENQKSREPVFVA